ncbi:YdeI family protein [Phyllobacterium sp. SB3]|uniref:YdeI/OmpD-associated family protein n=1 Tax=Phyllobacterium sp. SB3 TaxID=3156073 RepID=UPI0032AEF166
MAKSITNPKVDAFLNRSTQWKEEFGKLRSIALECDLAEELKWGVPCYTFGGSNIVLIHGFRQYCALLFIQGALLKDTDGVLIQQTKNVQSARQIRFTGLSEIAAMKAIIKAYIQEAIEIQKAGLKVVFKKTGEFAVPHEFQARLDSTPDLKTAFEALTPGRQRGYLLHFSSARQSKTREARIEKSMPKILDGKGLDD